MTEEPEITPDLMARLEAFARDIPEDSITTLLSDISYHRFALAVALGELIFAAHRSMIGTEANRVQREVALYRAIRAARQALREHK